MTCEHCCFSCNAQGDDMSKEVFHAALELCADYGGYITLGGGEPTLHPNFREFLIEAIAADEGTLFIATNGSVKRHALLLAKLARREVIQAELSRDDWHDDIDWEVVEAFRGMIRDISNGGMRDPKAVGRGLTVLEIEPNGNDCACSDICIKPNGDAHVCGCPDAPCIGNVFDGIEYPEEWGECHKNQLVEV
jgi:MoaA/NifB/PqqE/SkfB family radical SAM enzyme